MLPLDTFQLPSPTWSILVGNMAEFCLVLPSCRPPWYITTHIASMFILSYPASSVSEKRPSYDGFFLATRHGT